MALLINVGQAGWYSDAELRELILGYDPTLDVRTPDTIGNPEDIRMLAVSSLRGDLPETLPNLELVQKLGAGVETIVNHPSLADHVRVARLKPEAPAREIAEYCLAYVLREQRSMRAFEASQNASHWAPVEPRETLKTKVGVLGLGHIGGYTARLFGTLGFETLGWSRSHKSIEGVTCLSGADGLNSLLGQCDHVVSILPSTAETRDLFDTAMFQAMKPGSTFINAGRGDLVVEEDLEKALNAGQPGHAVLDVLRQEPLPSGSPLWSHAAVTITPHVSGWHLGDAFADVAANYRNLRKGRPLLHEVDRVRGY